MLICYSQVMGLPKRRSETNHHHFAGLKESMSGMRSGRRGVSHKVDRRAGPKLHQDSPRARLVDARDIRKQGADSFVERH